MNKYIFILIFSLSNLSHSNDIANFTYMTADSKNVKWQKLPVKLCLSKEIPTILKEQFLKSVRTWNDTFQTQLFDASCEIKDKTYSEGQETVHGVYWIKNNFEKFTEKTSLARTLVEYEENGQIHDVDILLNAQFYDWDKVAVDPQTVFIHELGHVLGLKHFFISLNSAMNYYPYVSGYVHRSIGEYETLVINKLYLNKKINVPPYLKYYFLGEFDKTIGEIKKNKKLSWEEEYVLAYIYKSQKNNTLAKSSFERTLEKAPKNGVQVEYIRQQFGDLLWSMGELEAAKKEFQSVIRSNSKNYEALANLGAIALSENNKKLGLEFLKKSLSVHPANWPACTLLHRETKEEAYNTCIVKYGPKE